jgi:putative heme-binding domain-containing protein
VYFLHRIMLHIFVSLVVFTLGISAHAQSVADSATPIRNIKAADGFKVELLYSVPKPAQGSWVAMCHDDKGRIIVSDQFGGLYRFSPPAAGEMLKQSDIEAVPAKIRAANGLLWAAGALYVGVNDYERKFPSGLYRVTDSNGDDKLDKVEHLRELTARGDHGIHAILPGPKGTLYLITGNNTTPLKTQTSRVPMHWGEDHLLPRMPDGRGHNRDRLAPGGIIYKVSLDGKTWEIVSSGYRNIYDGGVNRDGELFAYDADMEYDFNTSWYRPTRINHVTSGSMYGWRNGTGKRPEFYPDTLPPVINIGPGSPTGVTFGYGAKFPAKYQDAMYILDWSWGKIHAVHLKPDGSSYTATKETFITGSPLPVTDVIIHPVDRAMYFTIGGRKVQSGLYRVTYTGKESTALVKRAPKQNKLTELRHQLEKFHGVQHKNAVTTAWPHLSHPDRFVRWAAMTAVMHQPVEQWRNRALGEKDPNKRVVALLGLCKVAGSDPKNRKPDAAADLPEVDRPTSTPIFKALSQVKWNQLDHQGKLTLVRTYQIALVRFGEPNSRAVAKIVGQLDPHFPAPDFEQNWLLCETLAYLQAPNTATKGIQLLNGAATQEEQIEYARSLRMLKQGWTMELRESYFNWFLKASNYRGGASFSKFIEFIRRDAEASLDAKSREQLKGLLAKKPKQKSPYEIMAQAMIGRNFVKEWKLKELSGVAKTKLKNRNFERGRKMFAAGGCFACHRFANEGGMTGPDLTGAGGRYSAHDLLEQIINPSKEINEQFVPVVVKMKNGDLITGVVVNMNGDRVTVNTDMFDPNQRVNINRPEVKSIEPSKVSPMPPGLLNLMREDEVMDLLAYILSGGDRNHSAFKK